MAAQYNAIFPCSNNKDSTPGSMDTEVIDKFPVQFQEIEHALIPLSDGTNLAVRYWLPLDAAANPVPAILEYIPYCKRDGTAARDEAMHPYFAGHGYAALRVDIRGSGESEGVLLDEYLSLEQDDAVEVIAWIAAQPWCNGKVGMMGKSWGGFNGLQVAARQPDALKCIITVYFTDDRYADDVHYIGGCMALENPAWAFVMFPAMARPPDPELVGESWREMWMQRLQANRPWVIDWVTHQRRDDYWKHGSVCEDFSQIKVPVYAIGGWADLYSSPVPRALAGLDVPRKGLIGPWGHQYMHQAVPGPKMGFMDEALRWWDYWLKDIDTGIMDEPQYRVWVQDSIRPSASHAERPGYWASEEKWPSQNVVDQKLYMNAQGLCNEQGTESTVVIDSPQTTGQCTPFFGNMGAGEPQDPLDQRTDDALSACFDGDLLEQDTAILGAPTVSLELASDQADAFVCVRLNELLANGESLQVTYGFLNLTHRNSHEHIEPLEPGSRYRVNFALNDIAHTFAAGSRVRIAISTAFWPWVWPSPRAVRLSLFTAQSYLTLPTRKARADDARLAALAPPKQSRVQAQTTLQAPEPMKAEFHTDLTSGLQTFTYTTDTGKVRIENNGWCFSCKTENRYSIHPDDPNSAVIDLCATETYGREGQLDVRIEARQVMTSDEKNFQIEATIEAFESDESVFRRQWQQTIERDGV
jgi:putative CocE/NonD family hydrolase